MQVGRWARCCAVLCCAARADTQACSEVVSVTHACGVPCVARMKLGQTMRGKCHADAWLHTASALEAAGSVGVLRTCIKFACGYCVCHASNMLLPALMVCVYVCVSQGWLCGHQRAAGVSTHRVSCWMQLCCPLLGPAGITCCRVTLTRMQHLNKHVANWLAMPPPPALLPTMQVSWSC